MAETEQPQRGRAGAALSHREFWSGRGQSPGPSPVGYPEGWVVTEAHGASLDYVVSRVARVVEDPSSTQSSHDLSTIDHPEDGLPRASESHRDIVSPCPLRQEQGSAVSELELDRHGDLGTSGSLAAKVRVHGRLPGRENDEAR